MNFLRRLLDEVSKGPPREPRAGHGRAFKIEALEDRRLLSADGGLSSIDGVLSTFCGQLTSFGTGYDSQTTTRQGQSESELPQALHDALGHLHFLQLVPEGEAPEEGESSEDLVEFAKLLTQSGTVVYGATWSADSSEQRRLFQDGAKYLPFVNVTNPDRTPNQLAAQHQITVYPTWVFDDGSRLEGMQSLATIALRSGLTIPQSMLPYLGVIANTQVGIGSPLHVPIDAYSPTGRPLTLSVQSSNPGLIQASVLGNNRSMLIKTDFGDMVFELFEDKAPRPAGRVIELAESGFYDGIIFHRVINGFMIQGGDPTGTGTSGSSLGNFDDQFHLDLQHNRSGVLSFAKAGDDSNNSQFFITAAATRHLDFNHSIFGQLVEGEHVRQAISGTATGSADRPVHDVIMRQVSIFTDSENGVVFLKPTGTGTGSANITVTVSDGQGNQTSRTFVATVAPDTANGGPFLNEISVLQATAGVPLQYTLTSQDAEGDPVLYAVATLGSVPYELSVDASTGVVTFTAPGGYVGQLDFLVGVRQATPSNTSDVFDVQRVIVQVNLPPVQFTLNAESDSGASNSDRVTNATSLKFTVTGVTAGATVEILAGSQVVATATASGLTAQVTVANVTPLGEGMIAFTARRTVLGQASTTPVMNVRLDRTPPNPIAVESLPAYLVLGTTLDVNLSHPEENQGLRYSLQNAPSGMTINSTSGQLRWTPGSTQKGNFQFVIGLTDLAGNLSTQSAVSLRVVQPPTATADAAYTLKNESVSIPVLSNDIDGGGSISPSTIRIEAPATSGQVEVLSNGQIRYVPNMGFVGTDTFAYAFADELGLRSNSALVTVRVLNSRWQNPISHLNVNADERISAIDALLVINYLNSSQPRNLVGSGNVSPPYLDVNGDERVSALDALLVINHLNQRSGSAEGEGVGVGSIGSFPVDVQAASLITDGDIKRRKRLLFEQLLEQADL